MEAHRQIVDIKDNSLTIKLPRHIKDGKAELIILPLEENQKNKTSKPSDYIGCISKKKSNRYY